MSHTIRCRSKLAETRRRPSGLNASALTGWRCPDRVWRRSPVSASQIITPPLQLPDARRRPSGLNATLIARLLVSGEAVEELAVPPVPEVHRPLTPRRQAPAVGAEGHAIGRPIVDADESGAG